MNVRAKQRGLDEGKEVIQMANKTTSKPAKRGPAKGTKPARKQPATKARSARADAKVTVKDLAKRVGRDEKSVRASIRRILGGPQVNKGGRYGWKSWSDPQLKKIIAGLQSNKADSE